MYRKEVLIGILLVFFACWPIGSAVAQSNNQSPEAAQMLQHAKEYMDRGDLKDAIITYRQAIKLWPDNTALYTSLSNALYLEGNYKEAEQILKTATEKKDATPLSYQLLAASQEQQQDKKTAKNTLQKGLSRFPGSGLLYNELGNEYEAEQKSILAVNAWVDGIEKAPGYPDNYYKAAQVYLASGKQLWGLLYGEQYLYMSHDTINDDTLKQQLYVGYKTFFSNIGSTELLPEMRAKVQAVYSFEDAVMQVYTQLTPVVSDGITTENLTMVRTRFLMDWFAAYGKQYPFSLFAYQNELVSSGHFDMSNEWIFGKAESYTEYETWNKFHEGDMGRYLKWQAGKPLQPVSALSYNSRNVAGFDRKK
ncbi:MAG: hypothetical protein JWQ38_3564 [Flavipsychrobacter sp.]|nr:hypothetical protein [Flavipsychrobacter sp.]